MHEDVTRIDYKLSPRAMVEASAQRLRQWASNEVLQPLVEPILHPSRWRIRALGVSTMAGHPLFWFIWSVLLPQPYENLFLRLVMSGLGAALLVFPGLTATPPSRLAALGFSLIFWVTLPLFFSWMYFRNGGNSVWLASLGATFLIYYHLTDWRLATLGSASGLAVGFLLYEAFGPQAAMPPEVAATNTVVIAFCWFMGLILGISSSNLRREQLSYTLGTMGIMAHELRTPLATMQLIGDAVRNEVQDWDPPHSADKMEKLATRLNSLVRNMNRQIDMQISNARLLRLPGHAERVQAADLVRQAIADYPFRSTRERESVVIKVHSDFAFRGSRDLFLHVVDNLTKNALRSLAAATTASRPGDLLIEIGAHGNRGRIVFNDRGVGIDADLQKRIFQPFFSTDRGTGHGLGLAFCQRVIAGAHGSIRVKSQPLRGAIFTIELPVSD